MINIRDISKIAYDFIIGCFYSAPKVNIVSLLESVVYANSVCHIQIDIKGAYLIKINEVIYPVKKLYAFNTNVDNIEFKIEIIGIYKTFQEEINVPIHTLKTNIPFSKIIHDFELKQPINKLSGKAIQKVNSNISELELKNKKIYLNKFYKETNHKKTHISASKEILTELETLLKNENI